ncbi:hypothetical protein MUB15_31525 [Priestia sp. OVS21]|nr:hypothetical protein [Priestia sp. OVS21]
MEPGYIQTLFETINQNLDVNGITFDVEVNLSGLEKITKYDINYFNLQDNQYYYRKPNHIMCYVKRIAI